MQVFQSRSRPVTDPSEPRLAPPGAGLPLPELFLARLLFAWRRRTSNPDSLKARFETERSAIRRLVNSCTGDSGGRRVLIARPRGLEDSSRYWSVWMTLDHLRIVHHAIRRVILALTKGHTPEGTASTAAVKPAADVDSRVMASYEDSCDVLRSTIEAAENLKTPQRYRHPWFGPLDAAGWHVLSVGHLRIHRVQIERICAGLAASQTASPAKSH